jgi:hypothetical protein
MPRYSLIDGCPFPYQVAPYVYLVLRHAGVKATSGYRGDDPTAGPYLRRYGKHTQRQMWAASPATRAAWGITGTPNRPGQSMHELRSDGRAKPGPVGRVLQPWEIGIDAGPNTEENRRRLRAAARHYGLSIYFPYDAVVEYHHFGFRTKPRPNKRLTRRRVIWTRTRLRVQTANLMRGHWS